VFAILREEIRSVDPNALVPDQERLVEVGRKGSLDSPEALAILAELEAAATKAGLPFPASLKPAALSTPTEPMPP
jgi:hypothetical protein